MKAKFEKIKNGMDKEMEILNEKLGKKEKKLEKVQKTMKEQIQQNEKLSEKIKGLKEKKELSETIVAKANEEYKRFKNTLKTHSK